MEGVLDELLQNVEQNRIDWANVKTAIVAQGIDVPDETPTSEYGDKILSIESGVDTSEDTVVPSALREGYTAHDAAGQPITGTIPNYSGGNTVEMTSPDGATMNTAGTYCEGDIEIIPKLQSKTATTGEIVTADDGYVGLSEVDTNPVFEAGKKSEYDAFWDAVIWGLNSVGFNACFAGAAWNNYTFKPDQSLYMSGSCAYAFYVNQATSDLVDVFESIGKQITITNVSNANNMFQFARFLRIPTCSFASNITLTNTFTSCFNLIQIDSLMFDETVKFLNTFAYSKKIQNLTIDGVIGQNGFNTSWSPLSKASLTSIVNALSSTTTGQPVTLRLAAVNAAFETSTGAADGSTSEEWTALIATKPNWTINLINS
jgi:hypothetical protein